MRNKVNRLDQVCLVLLGLIIITPSVRSQQGCEIVDNPGTAISIYDVSLQDFPNPIGVFIIENTVRINEVQIEGMTEEYFQATLNDDNLIIHTTENFGTYRENEVETVVNLRIQFRCSVTGSTERDTNFIFTIYLRDSNDYAPTFSQSEYELVLPLPLPANFELTFLSEIVARDIDLNDNRVSFTGGNNYFSVGTIGQNALNPKEYAMSLKTTRQILFLPEEFMTFVATATDHGELTGQATIRFVSDPDNTYNRDPSPTFESSTYHFRVDEDGNYYNNYCYVTENSYDETEITFRLQGMDVQHFVIDREDRAISVLFAGTYTEEEFGERTYLTVDLVATRAGYDNGHATIIVDLPVVCAVDEPEVTTPAPCEITTCPDDDGPIFSQKVYTYRVFEGTSGAVGQVEATIDDPDVLATLKYRLNYNDAAPLTPEIVTIDEATGSISIVDMSSLTATSFNIEVLATVELEDTTKVGSARVVLVIDANEKCSETPVSKSLTFVTVREEQANADIFPMSQGDCEFELLSFTPNDNEYLFVNENHLLSTIVIDRESESFGMMSHPQIQAKLKLICPAIGPDSEAVLLRKRRALEDFVDNIFTDEIAFNSDILTLNVLIEDINDNAPVFDIPAASVTEIGYPDVDVVGLLLPPYLIKVAAIDSDIGDNAKITYGLSANNYFGIDSQSGVIYPKTMELGSDVLSLEVTASDGVHNPSVRLNVHRVTLDHLVVIYVENYGFHEVEAVENYLKTQLATNLNILKYGNVPGETKKKSQSRATAGTNLKLVVYAFDGDSQLVTASGLIEKLDAIEGTSSFALTSGRLEDEITVIQDLEADSTVFVAVIVTLAILVVILLGGGFVGWWFWIRPTEWKHVEESRSNSLENVQTEFAEIQEKGSSDDSSRPSVTLKDHTWTESTDGTTPQIIKNAAGLEERIEKTPDPTPILRERKKSITFNENVERIEIEAEVPVTVNSYQF